MIKWKATATFNGLTVLCTRANGPEARKTAKANSIGRTVNCMTVNSKTTNAMAWGSFTILVAKSSKDSGKMGRRTEDAYTLGRMGLGTISFT